MRSLLFVLWVGDVYKRKGNGYSHQYFKFKEKRGWGGAIIPLTF